MAGDTPKKGGNPPGRLGAGPGKRPPAEKKPKKTFMFRGPFLKGFWKKLEKGGQPGTQKDPPKRGFGRINARGKRGVKN